MSAFARALRQLPAIIADNGGYDSAELVSQLRAAHASGKNTYGLDMYNGTIGDMKELGVAESFKSKLCVLLSASEAAEMILRVDGEFFLFAAAEDVGHLHSFCLLSLLQLVSDIIKCAPRAREQGY
jgi:hypothetical protein